MKTTAIFVEQVFVGLIVLAIGALPFYQLEPVGLNLNQPLAKV